MQKYSRFLIVVTSCALLIAFFGASAVADSGQHSWLKGALARQPFSLFDRKSATNARVGTPDALSQKYHRYAALGDSVAAGSGLSYVNNATVVDKTCARSDQSYPAVLSMRLQAKLIFAACGGATTDHLTEAQPFTTAINKPQLDQAFAGGKPDLVTITLGANDIRWIEAVTTCYTSDCTQPSNTAALTGYLTAFEMKLHYDIHEINKRSGKTVPKIILTGYYTFGSPTCLADLAPEQITASEVTWFDQQTERLNDTIKATARQFPNVQYAAIDTGTHGLCASDSQRWVQNISDKAAFHLTAPGEKALADAIYEALQK